jgi:signal transduction histidine kinase
LSIYRCTLKGYDIIQRVLENALNQITQKLSVNKLYLLILAVLYIVLILRAVHLLPMNRLKLNRKRVKWILLLLLLIIPAAYIGRFQLRTAPIASSLGFAIQPHGFVFALIPSIFAIGTVGLWFSLVLAAAGAGFQTLLLRQEPMMVFVYTAFITIFSVLLHKTNDEKKNRLPGETARLIVLAWTGSLLVLIVNQISIALLAGERSGTEILRQVAMMALAYLPTGIAAAMTSYAHERWAWKIWDPRMLFNPASEVSDSKTILDCIAMLKEGEYSKSFADSAANQNLAEILLALDSLRGTLAEKADAQKRLLSVDPAYYARESYDLALSAILRSAIGREAASARVIVFNTDENPLDIAPRIRMGQGENTRLYAYLDFAIIEKIGNQLRLVLSDLRPDSYFGIASGSPAPLALIAHLLNFGGEPLGILWVGFSQNYWFTPQDIEFYDQLAARASAVLGSKERSARIQAENIWLKSAFEALNRPLKILDAEGQTVFENLAFRESERRQMAHEEYQGTELSSDDTLRPFAGDAVRTVRQTIGGYGTQAGTLITQSSNGAALGAVSKFERDIVSLTSGLRSPLKMVDGYLQLLRNIGNLNDEQEKYLDKIYENLDYLSALVDRTQDTDASEFKFMKTSTFDIRELIEGVISLVTLQAQRAKVGIKTDFSALRNPYLNADYILIRQAVYALVENAIRFSNRDSQVLISVYKDYDWLYLLIVDEGKGIAPIDQPTLNESDIPEAENGEPKANSIALVKQIIERHSGTMDMSSQLGKGTTVRIGLPLKRP